MLSKEALTILSKYTNLNFTLDKKGKMLLYSADRGIFSLDNKNVTLNMKFKGKLLPKIPMTFPYMQNSKIVVVTYKNIEKIQTLPVTYIFSKRYLKNINYDFTLPLKIFKKYGGKTTLDEYLFCYYSIYLNSIRYYNLKTISIIIKYIGCFLVMSSLKKNIEYRNHIHYEMRKMVLYLAQNNITCQHIIEEYENMEQHKAKYKPFLELLKKNYMLKKIIDDYMVYLTFLNADLTLSLKFNQKQYLDPDGFRNSSPINKYNFNLKYVKNSINIQSQRANFDYNENRDLISHKRLNRQRFTNNIKRLLCLENF